jgi:hypothetical protein
MMLLRTLLPCLVFGTFFVSCSNEHESRVSSFNCGPEPDTTIAILSGRIVERKIQPGKKDTLVPLANAVISLEEGRRTVSADSSGAFRLYLDLHKTHPFTIARPGYQSLKVEGFFAEKETLANISIVLAKGTKERTGRVTMCKIAY